MLLRLMTAEADSKRGITLHILPSIPVILARLLKETSR
jgi:hypothetical protein